MRKLIAAFNMTLDGICDHTVTVADEEIHQHYTNLLNSAGTILYGRITYQLMENYWPGLVKSPSGKKSYDEFAIAIQQIEKIVFSHTLKNTDWENARLATRSIRDEVTALKQQEGRDILAGSRSLIVALMNLNLVDEYQFCVQPIVAGKGLRLFENINDRIDLKLIKTKVFASSGSVIHYYEPTKK